MGAAGGVGGMGRVRNQAASSRNGGSGSKNSSRSSKNNKRSSSRIRDNGGSSSRKQQAADREEMKARVHVQMQCAMHTGVIVNPLIQHVYGTPPAPAPTPTRTPAPAPTPTPTPAPAHAHAHAPAPAPAPAAPALQQRVQGAPQCSHVPDAQPRGGWPGLPVGYGRPCGPIAQRRPTQVTAALPAATGGQVYGQAALGLMARASRSA